MRLFGLIGYPLGHSFSKKYFTAKFEKEGISGCRYELFPLTSIAELTALLAEQPELQGLNVTIPYKKEVLTFLTANEIPEGLQACNCIRIIGQERIGFNTDVLGFEKSLAPLLSGKQDKALVLGSGGAAESVLFVLRKLGISSVVVSRKANVEGHISYEQLTPELIAEHRLIINTTPLGTAPAVQTYPDLPYEGIGPDHLLYDLVYNPAKTVFLQKGEENGARIKNGEEMLVIQAEESWAIWNRG